MLTSTWRSEGLEPGEHVELEELARAAAEEDAEAGFSRIDAADAERRPGTTRHELLVRRLPRETGESVGLATAHDLADLPLAGFLRLTVAGDGTGEVQYVVHPAHRSVGLTTALLETLGLDCSAPGGWAGTGATSLVVWAHGNHPATGRAARRVGAVAVRRLWRMTRPFWGELADVLPDLPALERVAVRPMDPGTDADGVKRLVARGRGLKGVGRWTVTDADHFSDEGGFEPDDAMVAAVDGEVAAVVVVAPAPSPAERRGATARLRYVGIDPATASPEVARALVLAVLHVLRDRGFWAASAYVDADDDELTSVLLAATVEHEQSDVCYRVS